MREGWLGAGHPGRLGPLSWLLSQAAELVHRAVQAHRWCGGEAPAQRCTVPLPPGLWLQHVTSRPRAVGRWTPHHDGQRHKATSHGAWRQRGKAPGPGQTCPHHLVTGRPEPQPPVVRQRPFASGALSPLGLQGAHRPRGLWRGAQPPAFWHWRWQVGGPCQTQAAGGTGAGRRRRAFRPRVSWAQMEFLIVFRLAAEAPGEGRAWEPSSGSGDARGAGFRFGGHGSGRAGLGPDIEQDGSVLTWVHACWDWTSIRT